MEEIAQQLEDRYGAPAWLLTRSAEARAQAAGTTAATVLQTWAAGSAAPEVAASTPEPAVAPDPVEPSPAPATPVDAPTGLGGDDLLTAVAEARGMPASLLERSAKARASATGGTVDDVLREWAAEDGVSAPAPTPPAAPAAAPAPMPAPAAAAEVPADLSHDDLVAAVTSTGIPSWLVERSAEARAKATGGTVDEVLAGWMAGGGAPAPVPAPVAAPAAPAAAPTPAPAPEPAVATGPTLTGAALLAAVAEARGLPETIVERSASARAKTIGVALDDVLREWAEDEGLEVGAAPTPAEPAAAPAPVAAAPTPAAAPAPVAAVDTGLEGAELLAAVAAARGMPEWLAERSAAARAKVSGGTVDDVLRGWAGESAVTTAPAPTPAAEPAAAPAVAPAPAPVAAAPGAAGLEGAELLAAVAAARGMPESLTERSAAARAKKTGASVDDVLREWAGEAGIAGATPVAETPVPAAAPAAPAVGVGLEGAELLAAVAAARGMPESLTERSAKANAKKTGRSVDDVLREWAGEAGVAAESAPAPTPAPAAATPAVDAGLEGAALLTAVAAARGMPESLTERSAKANAKKTGRSVDDVLREWAAEAGAAPAAEAPTPAAVATPVVGVGLEGAALLTAVAAARGMPESLTERSAKANAKKTGRSVDDVLREWAAEAGIGAGETAAPTAAPAPTPAPKAPAPKAKPAPEPAAKRAPRMRPTSIAPQPRSKTPVGPPESPAKERTSPSPGQKYVAWTAAVMMLIVMITFIYLSAV